MRNFSALTTLGLILFAGCATPPPPPVEYKEVPGPSTNRAVLPPLSVPQAAPAPVRTEKHKPTVVPQQKAILSEQQPPAPVTKQRPNTTPKGPPTQAEGQKPVKVPKPKPDTVQKSKPSKKSTTDIVTPDASLRGKVARYNEAGRFVVLEFPIAHLPGVGQKLFVYRQGMKVGEVKVTGPQRDDRTVADVTVGEAQAGDEVREQGR